MTGNMNRVTKSKRKIQHTVVCGDIWTNEEDNNTYLVSCFPFDGKMFYAAVNLQSGICWTDPSTDGAKAVNGLTLYGRDVTIEIK